MSVNPDAVERTRRIVASAEQKVMMNKLRAIQEELHERQRDGIHLHHHNSPQVKD
jgi:hypothetical protein